MDWLTKVRHTFFGESRPYSAPVVTIGQSIDDVREQPGATSELEDQVFQGGRFGDRYRQLTCWNFPTTRGVTQAITFSYDAELTSIFEIHTGTMIGEKGGYVGEIELSRLFIEICAELGQPTCSRAFAPAIDRHWWEAEHLCHFVSTYSKDHRSIHGDFVVGELDRVAAWSPRLAPDDYNGPDRDHDV